MDYQAIIDGLTIDKVKELLLRLGVKQIVDKGTYLITNTICHNADADSASMKLYYYDNNKVFMCYSNCQTMSIFKFLQHYYETREIEYDWVSDIYNVVLDYTNFNPTEGFITPKMPLLRERYGGGRKVKQLDEYPDGVLDTFIKLYPPEWIKDNIGRPAMDKFNILYSISQNKIVIPHRDVAGRLVGIRGRALNEWEVENIGKYMPIKVEQTWYKHPLSMNLYGLYENQDNIRNSGVCYVFEGEKSVLQLESFSMLNCSVAVCGSTLNKYQLNILLQHCHPAEIVICFDNEELPGESTYFDKLRQLCLKYNQYATFSFVYDRQNLLLPKQSPSDCGEATFTKLLEKRVYVR